MAMFCADRCWNLQGLCPAQLWSSDIRLEGPLCSYSNMPPDSTRLVVLEDCIIRFYSDSDRNHLALQRKSSASLEAEAEIQKHSNQKIARKQCTRLRASDVNTT